mmetsp:Transcript_58305/g.181113  ORF Transcript_58305/g.181113 Transcript_58305/m.181113 type:complete len:323 (+) Transcript_58305:40-1008(+)
MRVKRQKNYRRITRFYRLAFDIQEPYHVLVDGTFLTHALQNKIHVKDQLPKMLNGRVTPMVTPCVLAELRSLGERALGAAIIAKGYYRVKCGHEEAIGAAECIKEQIGERNDRKFMLASQDPQLIREMRQVPGMPLLRLNGQVPLLEDPSDASKEVASAGEKKKLKPSDWEKPRLPVLKAMEAKAAEVASKPRKQKGPKGPNPLSCLKSKAAKDAKAKAAPEAAAQPAEGPPAVPKRVRSRRMGTRTRAEAEALLQARAATPAAAGAGGGDAHREEDEGEGLEEEASKTARAPAEGADGGSKEPQQPGQVKGGRKKKRRRTS